MDIDTRTGNITGVIRLSRDLTDKDITAIDTLFRGFVGDFFYIVHDKDTDENGVTKTKHLHFVLQIKSRFRLSTMLNKISDALGLQNANGIEISKTVNFVGSLQYLTHQNLPNKHFYDSKAIVTNCDRKLLDNFLCMDRQGLTIDYLITLCQQSNSLLDVMASIGLNYYTPYRAVIRDIWDEIKHR